MSSREPRAESLQNREIDVRKPAPGDDPGRAIQLCTEIADKYRLDSVRPLLNSAAGLVESEEITIAVLGRFKAGKSSFLNHLLGRDLLPVGVVPVTAIVTEIAYGPMDIAEVHYSDGRVERVDPGDIRAYVSEAENPENVKGVERLTVDLPTLEHFEGLTFVDTPGLESALAHNTEAAMKWLPNVGLALVAISVDPPLSQRDIDLIQALYAYTPNVSVLLTKSDLLTEAERDEVVAYIEKQLAGRLERAPRVYPYSVRPGYEQLRKELESALVEETHRNRNAERQVILAHKCTTLLGECESYLELAHHSAQTLDRERDSLRAQVIGEREVIAEEKSELRLIVQHAAAATRNEVMRRLEPRQHELELRMLADLRSAFPQWSHSLNASLKEFQAWAENRFAAEISALSAQYSREFTEPVFKVRKQIQRALQSFRDRLSSRTERAFGVPLRTTEVEIAAQPPRRPDIGIGRVFDRNWELLSPIAPMSLLRRVVLRHFEHKIPLMVYANFSRLATQWDENVRAALLRMQKDAEQRLDDLMSTVERLTASRATDVPALRSDLDRIRELRKRLEE